MFQISNLKFGEKGLGLVEIIVVIFIMIVLSSILVFNFPLVQRSFALSRVSYKVAEVFRRAQDLGLSGVVIITDYEERVPAKGYGVYFNRSISETEYFIYADIDEGGNQSCELINVSEDNYCNKHIVGNSWNYDCCIIEKFDLTKEHKDLYIKEFKNISGSYTSINFQPPNPTVNINNKIGSEVGIVIALRSDGGQEQSRTIWVNTKGLVRVE